MHHCYAFRRLQIPVIILQHMQCSLGKEITSFPLLEKSHIKMSVSLLVKHLKLTSGTEKSPSLIRKLECQIFERTQLSFQCILDPS